MEVSAGSSAQAKDDPWRLADALAGDEVAWAAIVDEFLPTVWHWARGFGLDRHEAEDVAQTVWYRLKDAGHTITEPARLAGWLATTTRREAASAKRRADRQRPIELVDGVGLGPVSLSVVAPGPEAAALATDLGSRVAQAFYKLSDTCRELLRLCWDDHLSYTDIAALLNRPVGSIGPTRQRCLGALRKEVGLDE